jgi:hypothetical protein
VEADAFIGLRPRFDGLLYETNSTMMLSLAARLIPSTVYRELDHSVSQALSVIAPAYSLSTHVIMATLEGVA